MQLCKTIEIRGPKNAQDGGGTNSKSKFFSMHRHATPFARGCIGSMVKTLAGASSFHEITFIIFTWAQKLNQRPDVFIFTDWKKTCGLLPKTKKIIYLFHHNINIYLHVQSKYPRQRRILLHLRVPIEKKNYTTLQQHLFMHISTQLLIGIFKNAAALRPFGSKNWSGSERQLPETCQVDMGRGIVWFHHDYLLHCFVWAKTNGYFSHCGQFSLGGGFFCG